MKFLAKSDIDAPIDAVFEEVSDFETFERVVLSRGATVTRTDTLPAPGPGMAWKTEFEFRGRQRAAEVTLTEYEPPRHLTFEAQSDGLRAASRVELVALSPRSTRMKLHIEIGAQTMSGKLIVQSLKLAKGNLSKRLDNRVAQYAAQIEERARGRA